jgi:hypothetical protein
VERDALRSSIAPQRNFILFPDSWNYTARIKVSATEVKKPVARVWSERVYRIAVWTNKKRIHKMAICVIEYKAN